MKYTRVILIAILALTMAAGCKNTGGEILPSISGKAGEVAVVCSKVEWEGEPGTTLRALLSNEVPYLPQVEPMYDLFNVPEQAFTKLFRVHRNIIVFATDKKYTEGKYNVFNDVWATPQTVINIQAPDGAAAAAVVAQRGEQILATLENAERARIISNINTFENHDLGKTVGKIFGGSPVFPNGYTVKKATDNFVWVSYETTYTNQSILMWKYPYQGESSLTPEALAAKRNEITKEHIPCTMENSYMILNPDIFPGSRTFEYQKRSIVEMHGLWEAYNDFMGGPFVSHTFLSQDGSEIITADAFVYAPKYDKRNYLRQVEAMLYSFEWSNPAPEE